jgi:toxin ParE1/3/4
MRVRYTPRARDDIASILSYLELHSPQGARNVARAMRKTLELIGQFPQSGRPVEEFGIRVLRVGPYPYLIYWSAEADEVWVVHVRQRPAVPGIRPWTGLNGRVGEAYFAVPAHHR